MKFSNDLKFPFFVFFCCPKRLNWSLVRTTVSLIGCFLVLGNKSAQAVHMLGGEFSYEYIQQNQYRVNLILYRDCYGIGFPTQTNIEISSNSCGLNPPPVTLTLDTFYEVSTLCDSVDSECDGGAYIGIERYIYTGIVTFPQSCTDWILSYSTCCRTPAITNIINPGASGTYIDAMINSTLMNSSPQFTSLSNVSWLKNQCHEYNHGGVDEDGDSLVYALSCVYEHTPLGCIPFQSGFSAQQPFMTSPTNSLSFNTHTGQMSFCLGNTPSEYCVFSIIIYEIRAGDTIGYVRREIGWNMLTSNTLSSEEINSILDLGTVSGGTLDTAKEVFTAFPNQTLSFDHVVYNSNGLPVKIDSVNTNLDVVFGVGNWSLVLDTISPYRPDSVRATLQLNITNSQVGHRMFSISFYNPACPVKILHTLGYGLYVPGINAFIVKDSLSSFNPSRETYCPGTAQNIALRIDSKGRVGNYHWTQVTGPPLTFSNATSANTQAMVPNTTQEGDSILILVTFDDGQNIDSSELILYFVSKTFDVELDVSKVWLCLDGNNDTINFTTTIFSDLDTLNANYTWSAIPSSYLTNLNGTNIPNPAAIINASAGDSVTYILSYNEGTCIGVDSIQLKTLELGLSISASQDTICLGDTLDLMTNTISTLFSIDSNYCNNYSVTSIPFSPEQGSGTSVILSNNALSTAIPIGFDFQFYCNTYNQFYISSNGFISFDALSGNGCCVGQSIPDAAQPNNLIAPSWEDLNPAAGGTIEYFMVGVAPNRKLVVNYLSVPKVLGTDLVTVQLVLHEGSNWIDIHSTEIGLLNAKTQGIENSDGSLALSTFGRNAGFWTASNDAYRFSYSDIIVFEPFVYTWTPSITLSDATISDPQAFPSTTTTYQVVVEQKGCVEMDSIEVALYNAFRPNPPTVQCALATIPTNTVAVEWGQVAGVASWEYTLDGGATWIGQPLQDSSLEVNGLVHDSCYAIAVRALTGTTVCGTSSNSHFTCCTEALSDSIEQNGLTVSAIVVGANISYQWVDCDNGNTPITGATGQTFSPTVNGNYAVMISDGVNTVLSDCININVTSLKYPTNELNIICYPNPTTGILQIEKEVGEEINVQLLDCLGRILFTQKINELQSSLDLSAYPSGLYTIQFSNGLEHIRQKIIKQ